MPAFPASGLPGHGFPGTDFFARLLQAEIPGDPDASEAGFVRLIEDLRADLSLDRDQRWEQTLQVLGSWTRVRPRTAQTAVDGLIRELSDAGAGLQARLDATLLLAQIRLDLGELAAGLSLLDEVRKLAAGLTDGFRRGQARLAIARCLSDLVLRQDAPIDAGRSAWREALAEDIGDREAVDAWRSLAELDAPQRSWFPWRAHPERGTAVWAEALASVAPGSLRHRLLCIARANDLTGKGKPEDAKGLWEAACVQPTGAEQRVAAITAAEEYAHELEAQGHLAEGLAIQGRVLDWYAEECGWEHLSRGGAVCRFAELAWKAGQPEKAEQALASALADMGALDQDLQAGTTTELLSGTVAVLRRLPDLGAALTWGERLLEAATALNDPFQLKDHLLTLADVAEEAGQHELVQTYRDRAAAIEAGCFRGPLPMDGSVTVPVEPLCSDPDGDAGVDPRDLAQIRAAHVDGRDFLVGILLDQLTALFRTAESTARKAAWGQLAQTCRDLGLDERARDFDAAG